MKIIDKRASHGGQDEVKPVSPAANDSQAGETFVMKDGPSPEKTLPAESIDFHTFILSLATGVYLHLGLTPDPSTQKTTVNLPLARQTIDLLALLLEKTKGNLTPDESTLLEHVVTDARLRFVERSSGRVSEKDARSLTGP